MDSFPSSESLPEEMPSNFLIAPEALESLIETRERVFLLVVQDNLYAPMS